MRNHLKNHCHIWVSLWEMMVVLLFVERMNLQKINSLVLKLSSQQKGIERNACIFREERWQCFSFAVFWFQRGMHVFSDVSFFLYVYAVSSDFYYQSVNRLENQVELWNHFGLLSSSLFFPPLLKRISFHLNNILMTQK